MVRHTNSYKKSTCAIRLANENDSSISLVFSFLPAIIEHGSTILPKYCMFCLALHSITDSGSLNKDVEQYIINKRSNILIKYNNFCRKHFTAPLDIKLNVLNTCANASITYACETWSYFFSKSIETMHRHGLKTALSIRCCTNNEIVYLESGHYS